MQWSAPRGTSGDVIHSTLNLKTTAHVTCSWKRYNSARKFVIELHTCGLNAQRTQWQKLHLCSCFRSSKNGRTLLHQSLVSFRLLYLFQQQVSKATHYTKDNFHTQLPPIPPLPPLPPLTLPVTQVLIRGVPRAARSIVSHSPPRSVNKSTASISPPSRGRRLRSTPRSGTSASSRRRSRLSMEPARMPVRQDLKIDDY